MMEDITHWLTRLHDGDAQAAQAVWERYFGELVRLARIKLGDMPRRSADEEDVALSAMNSFFRGAKAGRFPQLTDSDDLWKILATLTARKAAAERTRQFAQKRGGGKVGGQSAMTRLEEIEQGAAKLFSQEPTPELAAQMAETCRAMLESLGDETLQQIALERMEGFTIREIADRFDVSEQTIHRKLRIIRSKWATEEDDH